MNNINLQTASVLVLPCIAIYYNSISNYFPMLLMQLNITVTHIQNSGGSLCRNELPIENVANCSLGVLMYCCFASVLTFDTPAALAEVAALVWKLYVLYCKSCEPICFKKVDNALLKYC